MVFFPYFLPMILTAFPMVRIIMKLREGPTGVQVGKIGAMKIRQITICQIAVV